MRLKKFKHCEIHSEKFVFWIAKIGIELHWPTILWNKKSKGIWFKTLICFQNPKSWSWLWAFAILILGFGVGVSYNHSENPNYDESLIPE